MSDTIDKAKLQQIMDDFIRKLEKVDKVSDKSLKDLGERLAVRVFVNDIRDLLK